MAPIDDLKTQVTAITTVAGSAIALIQGLAAQLANNPSPEQIAALSTELQNDATNLAAAITANTPAAPTA